MPNSRKWRLPTLEKNAPVKKLVLKAWAENKAAGYYSGLAKVDEKDREELEFLYQLKRTKDALEREEHREYLKDVEDKDEQNVESTDS
jgi:hypothetical protein